MTSGNRRWFGLGLTPCLTIGVTVAIGLAGRVAPAYAQEVQQTDVSAGYLNVMGSMNGWYVQVSHQLSRRWSLVGQVDGAYGPDCSGCEPDFRDVAGLGGVRFGWRPTARVSPFAQVLMGGVHSKAAGYYYDTILGERYQPAFTVNYRAVQPGAGVTVMVSPRFGIMTQADLMLAVAPEHLSIFPRVSVGGVIRLGRP